MVDYIRKPDVNEPETPIDFVITWVDGSDPAWQAECNYYLELEEEHLWSKWATGEQRSRDWELLRYWFRGVEKFAPWVNKVHFVSWGHVPSWLNLDNPKLHVVNHDDFIPKEYLPTFSTHTIELNLHRIEGLAEQFTYFQDDFFLVSPCKPSYFFKHGLPRDFAGLDACVPRYGRTDTKPQNTAIINGHFDKRKVLRARPLQWFNPRYGIKCLIKTLSVLPYSRFTGIQANHLAYNLRKATMNRVWELEYLALDETCRHRFRHPTDCGIWLMQDWQRAEGTFAPISPQYGSLLDPLLNSRENAKRLVSEIIGGRHHQVVVNDLCETEDDFVFWREVCQHAFEELLPNSSSFELSQEAESTTQPS